MDDNNSSVQLNRLDYHDTSEHYSNIPTVSQSVYLQEPLFRENKPKTGCIRKSIFGNKWTLKINKVVNHGGDDKNKCPWSLLAFLVFVAFCSVVAVVCGIYFSLDTSAILENKTVVEDSTNIPNNPSIVITKIWNVELLHQIKPNETLRRIAQTPSTEKELDLSSPFEFCQNCVRPVNVCLKLTTDGLPTCVASLDIDDLTGCGGHCLINTHYCKLLDRKSLLYECLDDYLALECLDGAYSCGNHCISKYKVCDGVIDCQDRRDEFNCDCELNNQFRCGENISCLENFMKCDGRVDCWDASDEIGCFSTTCLPPEVACTKGGCIHINNYCDGIFHCLDKTDEPLGCEVFTKPKI